MTPMFNPAAARERCEAATARATYWKSEWRATATTAEKGVWYESIVSDLHDASTGFAAALEALEEAQGKLEAVGKEILSAPPSPRIRRMTAILSKEGE